MHLRAVGPVLDRLDVGEVAGEHCPDEDAERTQAHAERDQELNQRQGFHLRLPTCPPWLRARSRRRGARPRLHRRRWRPADSRQTPSTSLATAACTRSATPGRSEEHTSELQSLMRISYAVFCLKKKHTYTRHT